MILGPADTLSISLRASSWIYILVPVVPVLLSETEGKRISTPLGSHILLWLLQICFSAKFLCLFPHCVPRSPEYIY